MNAETNYWRTMVLNAPDVKGDVCAFCGAMATNRHHIAPKGMGGRKDAGPTVPVCGMGNTSGCHRLLHEGKLHMRYVGGANPHWEYVRFKKGTKLDEVIAREELLDWRPLRSWDLFGGL